MKTWDELHKEVMEDFVRLPDTIPAECEVAAATLQTRDWHISFEDVIGMTFAEAREYCEGWGYTLGGEGKSHQCWVKPISFALARPFRVLTLYRDIPRAFTPEYTDATPRGMRVSHGL